MPTKPPGTRVNWGRRRWARRRNWARRSNLARRRNWAMKRNWRSRRRCGWEDVEIQYIYLRITFSFSCLHAKSSSPPVPQYVVQQLVLLEGDRGSFLGCEIDAYRWNMCGHEASIFNIISSAWSRADPRAQSDLCEKYVRCSGAKERDAWQLVLLEADWGSFLGCEIDAYRWNMCGHEASIINIISSAWSRADPRAPSDLCKKYVGCSGAKERGA